GAARKATPHYFIATLAGAIGAGMLWLHHGPPSTSTKVTLSEIGASLAKLCWRTSISAGVIGLFIFSPFALHHHAARRWSSLGSQDAGILFSALCCATGAAHAPMPARDGDFSSGRPALRLISAPVAALQGRESCMGTISARVDFAISIFLPITTTAIAIIAWATITTPTTAATIVIAIWTSCRQRF